MNPLVPTPLEGAAMIAALTGSMFTAAALVSVIRADRLTGWGTAAWVLIVLVFPVLGAVAWFVSVRQRRFVPSGQDVDRSR